MGIVANLVAQRIVSTNSEGFRADAYDDATGQPIKAVGVVTIGYGCACRDWSKAFAYDVMLLQLNQFEQPLLQEPWYMNCNAARRSALLEIAFNQGDASLINGYPKMIAAIKAQNWPEARAQCTVNDPRLAARYAMLGNILLTGELP